MSVVSYLIQISSIIHFNQLKIVNIKNTYKLKNNSNKQLWNRCKHSLHAAPFSRWQTNSIFYPLQTRSILQNPLFILNWSVCKTKSLQLRVFTYNSKKMCYTAFRFGRITSYLLQARCEAVIDICSFALLSSHISLSCCYNRSQVFPSGFMSD